MVCFNFILKQTFLPWSGKVVIALVSMLFVGLSWSFAIEQSKTQIASWINDAALMQDLAVVLTLDVVVQLSFCLLVVKKETSQQMGKHMKGYYLFLKWFPGIVFFPVLFALLTQLLFAFPGISFPLLAWSLAGAVLLSILLFSYVLEWLLPEREIRLELLFLCNILVALLGIVATVNGRTAVDGISSVNGVALLGVVLLVIIGGLAGFWWHHFQLNRKKVNK